MRWRSLIWFCLSLLCLVGAWYFWGLGERWAKERREPQNAPAPGLPQKPASAVQTTGTGPGSTAHPKYSLLSGAMGSAAGTAVTDPLAYQLNNSGRTVDALLRDNRAILLENALIDTGVPLVFSIPDHLRLAGDPGSYIVQSRGPVDEAFRLALSAVGAKIVSFIPNHAYLVRMSAVGAQGLQNHPRTQGVLPYEPYYKLKSSLLGLAVRQEALPAGSLLNVMVFADARDETIAALQNQNTEILAESRSPFGPVLTLRPSAAGWTEIARMPGVEVMELHQERVAANDLSRVVLGISTDTQVTTNYLGLTGSNVLVNVNDTGVDRLHPDLTNRVFGDLPASLLDTNGHGTHVAGIIAGSGAVSAVVTSNAQGSITPAVTGQFRGKAPAARIFSVALNNGLFRSDAYLQETAARTNALISNNSWNYAGENTYGMAAANYDAAVRDALPEVIGSQPALYVFPAGNGGNGNNGGLAGTRESILSPGTAKNVITVGAIEQLRNITNQVDLDLQTNTAPEAVWASMTDSDNQVARFSSRGNVGIKIEGEFGRYKPDVVAPGTFVISTRSTQWDTTAYYTPAIHIISTNPGIIVQPNSFFTNTFFVWSNTFQVTIRLITNALSPPILSLPIFVNQSGPATPTHPSFTNVFSSPPDLPLTPVGTSWGYLVGNPTGQSVSFDIVTDIVTTNDFGDYFQVLSNLNYTLDTNGFYRYEGGASLPPNGTSMAAADVAGTLALMQELFERRLGVTNSPALYKALLINGARSVNTIAGYDFQVQKNLNIQGWGLPNLLNTLPADATNVLKGVTHTPGSTSSILMFDQDPTNSLATGQSHTRSINLSEEGRLVPLRVTLVWTDPPGNPIAGRKLVNDLNLVVTNLDTREVFIGNNFPQGSVFTLPWDPSDTNAVPPAADAVNNVENVYMSSQFSLPGSNYSVTVYATNVNVNAVAAHANDVVQDYALVISSGDGEFTNALRLLSPLMTIARTQPKITWLTLVTPTNVTVAISNLVEQRVGANTPLLGTTNGMTNQWHFYVITNIPFSNVVFLTRNEFNLSIPRMGVREPVVGNATRTNADVDLYLSLNPALTNLDPVVLASALKSTSPSEPGPTTRGRAGSEAIVITNATPTQVFYLGVKCEDQMAAEFILTVLSSQEPFGGPSPPGFGGPEAIPDGNPALPGHTTLLTAGFIQQSSAYRVRRVVVTNSLYSENLGDLVGYLWHDAQKFVVLNNHRVEPEGDYTFVYEDNGELTYFDAGNFSVRGTDGPGSLRDFVGDDAGGSWYFEFADDGLTQTGLVRSVSVFIEPSSLEDGTVVTLEGNRWWFDSIDVPADGTELEVCISSNTLPLELYLRRGDFPTQTIYDHTLVVNPPGDCLRINALSVPPLAAGRYYVGVFNPNVLPQTFHIRARVSRSFSTLATVVSSTVSNVALSDDAITSASMFVSNNLVISSLDVGLLIRHPRISDLAITLISPNGTRILLFEDRGMSSTNGLGLATGGMGTFLDVTNMAPFYTNAFERSPVGLYAPGAVFEGWHVLSNMVTVFPDFSDVCGTNNLLLLAHGAVSNTLPTTNSTNFRLDFEVTHAPYLVGMVGWWPLDEDGKDIFGGYDGLMCCNVEIDNGKVNQALYTDGVLARMEVPQCAELDFGRTGRGFTIEGWINPSNVIGDAVMSDGFENAPEVPGPAHATGSFVSGWLVESGNVDLLYPGYGFFGLPDSGRHCLDLSGNNAGSISRNFNTVPGTRYVLNFAYSKNPASGNPAFVASATVSITGQPNLQLNYGQANTITSLNWSHTSIVFTASSPVTKLQLTSLNPGDFGMFLDSFSVHQVVYPSAPILEWNDPTPTNATPQGVQFWLSGLPGTNSPGALWANIWGTNSQPHILATLPSAVTNGGWQHIALTFEPNGTARIYANGQLVAQQGLGNFVPRTWGNLYFGFHPAGPDAGAAFEGGMDEFSVYERALSDCEIASIFRAGSRGKYGTNVLTCPVAVEVRLNNALGTITTVFTNGLSWTDGPSWETNSIPFTDLPAFATTNGPATNFTSIILRPLDPNVALDNFVLSALVTNVLSGLMNFTENTNVAVSPIKFAPSPFVTTNFPPNLVFSNDFENTTQRIYSTGAVIPGIANNPAIGVRDWTVVRGPITVVSNSGFGVVETNWVALAGGAVECELPTTPGHRYELSYSVRGPCAVGWWPGDIEPLSQRAQDLISGNHGGFLYGATNSPAGWVVSSRGANTLFLEGLIEATNQIATKIELGDPPQLQLTNALTIEGWILPTIHTNLVEQQIFFRGDSRNCLDPYYLALQPTGDQLSYQLHFHVEEADSRDCGMDVFTQLPLAESLIANEWRHIAAVFESSVPWTANAPWPTNELRLYIDGRPVTNLFVRGVGQVANAYTRHAPAHDLDPGFSPGASIGNRSRNDTSQPFRGNIDDLSVYGRALTEPEIAAIAAAGRAGKADLTAPPLQSLGKVEVYLNNGLTDVGLGDNSEWTTRKVRFTASGTNTILRLESLLPGTLVDAVALTEVPAELNYLPEESLAGLNGQNAFGIWRLEIWDTRTGATNADPELLQWELNFRLLPRNPLPVISLAHGIPHAGALPANGVQYFVVDVPQWALWATNVLQNPTQPVTVLFNQTNFPVPGDQVLLGPPPGARVLSTNSTPPVAIGRPYFLAVTNNSALPATFSLGVWFDILMLTNCQPITNFVGPAGIPRYFQFDVPTNNVPPGFPPREATFLLSGAQSNLTVVLSQHLPLPDLARNDYASERPCTNNEIIIVLTNSTPFPLQTNRWYAGVFNTAPTDVSFVVQACYSTNHPTLIPLTNGVPYVASLTDPFVAPPGPPRWFFFSFEITNFVNAVLFELYGLSGDGDLVLQRDVPPVIAPYFAGSFRMDKDPEQIVLRPSFELPDLRGKWYLGVNNMDVTNLAYTIRATVPNNGLLLSAQPIVVTNEFECSSRLLSWNSVEGERYFVQFAADGSNWMTLGSVVATTPCTTFVVPCMSSFTPVSWWPAEGNPGDTTDGNHGTLVGNSTYAAGAVCQGFEFDGNGDGVLVGNPTNLQLQNFTIEAWIKRSSSFVVSLSSTPLWGEFFCYGSGGYAFGIQSNSRLMLSKADIDFTESPFTITDTNFHHVAVTKAGSGVVFYLDGVAYPVVAPYNTTYTFTTPAGIGVRGDNLTSSFYGRIDELAIFNRPLTPVEIQAIYARGSEGKCSPCPKPISWWPAELDPRDIVDGNHGTLVDNATYGAGRVGQSFVFDGDRDAVEVGLAPNLQLQDFSIEGWIKRSSATIPSFNGNGNGTIFGLGTGGGGYGLWIQPDNRLMIGKSQVNQVGSAAVVADTNWHHVGVTKFGTRVVFYVDGVAYPAAPYVSGGFTFAAPGYVGAWRNPSGLIDNTFYGAIDELSIWGRELSAAEMQATYAAGSIGKCNNYRVVPVLGTATLPPLVLKIQLWIGNQVRISWPIEYPGRTLQSAPTVFGPWTNVGLMVTVEGNEFVVYDSIAGSVKFYRLQ